MKRTVIYTAVLLAALLMPAQGMDIGKLRPVGLIQLYKENEFVFIVTDTGDSGYGKTVEAAFENLEETTSGVIFLDTADYLLLSRTAYREAEALKQYLKSTIHVCITEKNIDPVQAAEYLSTHRPAVKMKDYKGPQKAQKLLQDNGRLVLK